MEEPILGSVAACASERNTKTALDREPREGTPGDPAETLFFCRRLAADPRFARLPPAHRYVLLFAALRWTDGNGVFFPKVKTWASKAGSSPRTVNTVVKKAVELKLLRRVPHAQPNGRQGSSTYRFDATLVNGVDPTISMEVEMNGRPA